MQPIAVLLLLLLLATPSSRASEGLVFGLIGSENRQTLEESFAPLRESLARALGMPVTLTIHEDYAGAIWSLGAGRTQLAWMGNKAALEAVDRAGAEVGLMTLTESGGEGYHAHLIVRKHSGLGSVDDVMARADTLTLGLGDPNSTSGSLAPAYYLFALRGVDPERTFKRVTRAHHEENFLAVAQGKVDVAATNSVDLERYKARHPAQWAEVQVIWTSPRIPSDPIVWRADLPPLVKQGIRECLVGFGRPAVDKCRSDLEEERASLARLKWRGFAASDNAQLDPVRRMDLFRRKKVLQSDPSLALGDKASRIKAIDDALLLLGAPESGPAP